MRRYVRKRFLLALLLVLILAGGFWFIRLMMIDPESLRARAILTLSDFFGGEVDIEKVEFDPASGLRIDNLRVFTRDHLGIHVIVSVRKVLLAYKPTSVIATSLSFKHVELEGASFFIERRADGTSNIDRMIETLKSRPDTGAPLPSVTIRDGSFSFTDHGLTDVKGRPLRVSIEGINASMTRGGWGTSKLRADVEITDPRLSKWHITNVMVDTNTGSVELVARSDEIDLDRLLKEGVGRFFEDHWQSCHPRGGSVVVNARARYDPQALKPVDFEITGVFKSVSAAHDNFLYRVDDISGTVVFDPEKITLKDLRARRGDTEFFFGGTIVGYGSDAGYNIRIEGKNIPLDARLREAHGDVGRNLWDDFSPTGVVDALCLLDREFGIDTEVRTRVLASTSPDSVIPVTYKLFPYPARIKGCVLYDNGFARIVRKPAEGEGLDNLKPGVVLADHKGTIIELAGSITGAVPRDIIDLDFKLAQSSSIELDTELRSALPEWLRQVWDYLRLSGKTNARCRVRRADPKQEELDLTVDLTDIRAQVRCKDFPYLLSNPEGSIRYTLDAKTVPRGLLQINNLKTRKGDTTIEVTGKITGFTGNENPEYADVTVRATNLLLNDELKQAIPSRYLALWDYLSPTPDSRVNATCRFLREHPDMEKPDFYLELESIDSSIKCADFPYRVEKVKGAAEYTRNGRFPDGLLRLKNLTSRNSDCNIVVDGMIGGFDVEKGIDSVSLTIEGKGMPLDERLRLALGAKMRKSYDAFSPAGMADIKCVLKRASRKDTLDVELTITPLGAAVRYDKFPVLVTDISGRIVLAKGKVVVPKDSVLRGCIAGGLIKIDGTLYSSDGDSGIDLTFRGQNILIGREIADAMPPLTRNFWRSLGLGGRVSVSGSMKQDLSAKDKRTFVYSGVIMPDNVSLKLGLPLSGLTGAVTVEGRSTPKGHEFSGHAEFSSAVVSGHPFKDLRGRFGKHENIFSIYRSTGQLYDGLIAASLKVDVTEPITYGVVVEAESLQLDKVLRRLFKLRSNKLRGRLSGTLMMQGQGTDKSGLVGRADLKVTDGQLWEIPTVLALLSVFDLSMPHREGFTDAVVKFTFYGDRMDVQEVKLLGSAISIYGSGRVKPGRVLDINFSTGLGRLTLPSIPIISPVIRMLSAQLIAIRMTGTLESPVVEILPIAPLTRPVKEVVDTVITPNRQDKKK